ncbi:hypothetical protein WMZ97_17360 [Lentibacillus sp. N15]|uniref:hypothetical protein n=1 Tax=Lentibacillus songyuanensis TaxID=3136161 RepID=UPI0031B9CFCB
MGDFNLLLFNVYGIGIYHPSDWQVFVNPNNKFTFKEGLVKIDKISVSNKTATSLSIRWASMRENIDLNDYVNELTKEFLKKEKKSRNKDRYKINEKLKYKVDGKEAYLLKTEFVANHSIYRIFGKDELVKVLQLLFFSKQTKRMVVASLSTTPEELNKNEDMFMKVLTSLNEQTCMDTKKDLVYSKL